MSSVEKILVYVWGMVLPWQTIWIYRYVSISGVASPYMTLGWYASEVVLWMLFLTVCWNARTRALVWTRPASRQLISLVLLGAFPLYAVIAIAWSQDIDVSLRHALYIVEGYMLIVAMRISGVPFREWLRAILLGSVVPLMLGLYQWFSQSASASTIFGLSEHLVTEPGTSIVAATHVGRWLRAYGSFPHPNIFGGYIVLIIGITMMCARYVYSSRERMAIGILHVLSVFVLCATFSRSALIGYLVLAAGCGVYALRNRVRLLYRVVGVGIMSMVCFFGIYDDLVHVRAVPVSITETRSIDERVSGVETAIDLFRARPVLGYGGGMFTHAWYVQDSTLPGYVYQPVHIAPLVVLVEYGVSGIVLVVCSLVGSVWLVPRERRVGYVICMAPLASSMFLDHYMATLYPGILIFSLYIGTIGRFSTHSPQTVPMS